MNINYNSNYYKMKKLRFDKLENDPDGQLSLPRQNKGQFSSSRRPENLPIELPSPLNKDL